MEQFYQTGFWTLAGVLVTGVAMLFVFYRWVSSFVEKINTRITELDREHAEKLSGLELEHTERIADVEREQLKRINEVEQNTVSKEECAATGGERSKPLLIQIEFLKAGQDSLAGDVKTLTDKIGELTVSVAALVVSINGKEKGK